MILSELFSSTYPLVNMHKHGLGGEVHFADETGNHVTVELLDFETAKTGDLKVYGLMFTRNNNGATLTGDGKDVSKIFATVIKAAEELITQEGHIDILFFSSTKSEASRVSLYNRLVDRLASKHGFKRGAPAAIISDLERLFDLHKDNLHFLTHKDAKL